MTWTRIGDFYNDDCAITKDGKLNYEYAGYDCYKICTKEVKFRSYQLQGITRLIRISHFRADDTSIIITATRFSEDLIAELVKQKFPPGSYHIDQYRCNFHLSINSKQLLPHLFALFNDVNDRTGTIIFDSELIAEIKQIYTFIDDYKLGSPHLFKHILNVKTPEFSHANPAAEESSELISVLDFHVINYSFDAQKFKRLLTQGQSVRQYGKYGQNPFWYAVSDRLPFWVLELLLVYLDNVYGLYDAGPEGWQYVDRLHGPKYGNAFEEAYFHHQFDRLKLLQAFVTRVQKDAQHESAPLKVEFAAMTYYQKIIMTGFHFTNGRNIKTELKHVAYLTAQEKDTIFSTLFSTAFEILNDPSLRKLKALFESDLTDQTKFIEIIRDDNTIIGFNLFKVIASQRDRLMVLIIDYALINPAYRGYGLMSLHAFRLAYALRQLRQDYKVAVFFLSVHFNSFKMIKDFLFYPKFQPEYMHGLIKSILNVIYDGDYLYVRDVMSCYVNDPLRVRGARYNGSNDLQQKFFYEHMLDMVNNPDNEDRAAPVCFFVDNENFAKLSQACLTLGIHFLDHIQNLARSFGMLMADHTHNHAAAGRFYGPENFSRIRNTMQFWFHGANMDRNAEMKMTGLDSVFSLPSKL